MTRRGPTCSREVGDARARAPDGLLQRQGRSCGRFGGGPTIDQVAAAAIGDQTFLPSILLERLMATGEGASNLLANSVVYATTELGAGKDHSVEDLPTLVAGRGGGKLVHPGVHYRSESNENNSDLLLAALQCVMPEATEVGAGGGYSTTPCAAIRA